jgi:ankyrin repeat protein
MIILLILMMIDSLTLNLKIFKHCMNYSSSCMDSRKRFTSMRYKIFCGTDVPSATAYQFIQHLRYIGGSFHKHILGIVSSTLRENEKLKIMSAAMTAIMPGWMTLETKVPVQFPINKPYVIISTEKENITLKEKIFTLFQNGDMQALQNEFDQGFQINQSLNLKVMAKSPDDLLGLAISFKNEKMFNFLLSTYSTHPHDSEIKQFVNLHRLDIIKKICEVGSVHMLRSTLDAGVNIRVYGHAYLIISAHNNHKDIFNLLLDKGAKPNTQLSAFVISLCLLLGGDIESFQRMVNEGLVDPNITLRGGHSFINESDGGFDTRQIPINFVEGTTLLHTVLEENQIDIAYELIKLGANSQVKNEAGETPYSITEKLIKKFEKGKEAIEETLQKSIDSINRQAEGNEKTFRWIFSKCRKFMFPKASLPQMQNDIQNKIDSIKQFQSFLKPANKAMQLVKSSHDMNKPLNMHFMLIY